MPESRPRNWVRRIGCSLAVLLVIEFYCLKTGIPDPAQIVFVYGYNGMQFAREFTSDTVARFHRRTPNGPPPDRRVVYAVNDFGFSLLRRLADATPGQNVFFSPYSVSAAATACANGANGVTKAAVLRTLRLSATDLPAAIAAQASLHEYLANTDSRIHLNAANSLWADSTVDLRPEFVTTMKRDLKASVESADLHSAAGMTRLTDWITRNSSAQLASGIPLMSAAEHIAFVNTITFHGKWKDQFKKGDTRPGEFHLEDGTTKTLPMMSRSGAVQVTDGRIGAGDQEYTIVNLPYGDGSVSMVLVVQPSYSREGRLSDLLPIITAKQVDQWMSRLGPHEDGITMPRFKAECRPDLDPALKMMGLAPAYDRFGADFTAMGTSKSGNPIYLSRTIHNAYLEVDEEGTRAGALTMHYIAAAGIDGPIRVDRPFICLIRDNRTCMILFAGAIYDPQQM